VLEVPRRRGPLLLLLFFWDGGGGGGRVVNFYKFPLCNVGT